MVAALGIRPAYAVDFACVRTTGEGFEPVFRMRDLEVRADPLPLRTQFSGGAPIERLRHALECIQAAEPKLFRRGARRAVSRHGGARLSNFPGARSER